MGLARFKLKDFIECERNNTEALRCDDMYAKAYIRRAEARVILKNIIPALTDFKKASSLLPDNKILKTRITELSKELKH